ncbi:hypothetical protein HO133_001526 [Letharia lupina]|uniref:Uncharacterized protein n=1 Tax=Letharia lupina TaxID=560253 RepID=A0A8H6FBN3_9LECA|nr:uncharacterized protein HO133_001526 [Letharia lupina]KAF6222440.1 hypothetical protein HO133_001526 [Letharia lupina]
MHQLAKHTIAVAITAFPIHVALATVHLQAGETGDDLVRILFLPYLLPKGPPVIKNHRVTLNQILTKLEKAARAADADIDELFFTRDLVRHPRQRAAAWIPKGPQSLPMKMKGGGFGANVEGRDGTELEEAAIAADGDERGVRTLI